MLEIYQQGMKTLLDYSLLLLGKALNPWFRLYPPIKLVTLPGEGVIKRYVIAKIGPTATYQ